MPSNSLPDADVNLPEIKTKCPSRPSGEVHMYVYGHVLGHKRGVWMGARAPSAPWLDPPLKILFFIALAQAF